MDLSRERTQGAQRAVATVCARLNFSNGKVSSQVRAELALRNVPNSEARGYLQSHLPGPQALKRPDGLLNGLTAYQTEPQVSCRKYKPSVRNDDSPCGITSRTPEIEVIWRNYKPVEREHESWGRFIGSEGVL